MATAHYILTDRHAIFATLHDPAASDASGQAVLICPPFGWEEVCSYRVLREWAMRLASDGHTALRFSYPATGDSSGDPDDEDLLGAWVGAVTAAAAHLRDASGCERLTAIGLNVGALLALLAVAEGAEIDDLVLWAPPATGHAVLRQMRAISKLERAVFFGGLADPEPLPAGELEVGGFRLAAPTATALHGIDLRQLALPRAEHRRVLVLDRDGITVDRALLAQLARSAVVTTVAGSGYADMTSHPQTSEAPLSLFDRVGGWLEEGSSAVASPGTTTRPERSALPLVTAAELDGSAGPVRETPLSISTRGGQLSAVLVQPRGPSAQRVGVVLLNAGAVRRVGPNRMWVEAARRWAGLGITSLRLDVAGIGDSDGDASAYAGDAGLYTPELVPQVLTAVDHLAREDIADRYVLGGLCAGAYWAFHAALADDRVLAALMVNPRALSWDSDIDSAREVWRILSQPVSLARLRRAVAPSRRRAVLDRVTAVRWRHLTRLTPASRTTATIRHETERLMARLAARGQHAWLLFSTGEPLVAELDAMGLLERMARGDTFTVDHLAVRDHTLRPIASQRAAHRRLDQAVERAIGSGLGGTESAATSESI